MKNLYITDGRDKPNKNFSTPLVKQRRRNSVEIFLYGYFKETWFWLRSDVFRKMASFTLFFISLGLNSLEIHM